MQDTAWSEKGQQAGSSGFDLVTVDFIQTRMDNIQGKRTVLEGLAVLEDVNL